MKIYSLIAIILALMMATIPIIKINTVWSFVNNTETVGVLIEIFQTYQHLF